MEVLQHQLRTTTRHICAYAHTHKHELQPILAPIFPQKTGHGFLINDKYEGILNPKLQEGPIKGPLGG